MKKPEPKHSMGRNAIRANMERAYRHAAKEFEKATASAKSRKCFTAWRQDANASVFLGMGDAYAKAGRIPVEADTSSARKAASRMWLASDTIRENCRSESHLSGLKRRRKK